MDLSYDITPIVSNSARTAAGPRPQRSLRRPDETNSSACEKPDTNPYPRHECELRVNKFSLSDTRTATLIKLSGSLCLLADRRRRIDEWNLIFINTNQINSYYHLLNIPISYHVAVYAYVIRTYWCV